MAKAKRTGVVRPSLFWFLLLDGGIVILSKLALSKPSYVKAKKISGDALPPREVLQALLGAAFRRGQGIRGRPRGVR